MRHFLSVNDCTTEELHDLLALSAELKGKDKNNTQERILDGKILAMVFEKASLRTRMSFQVAMADLGGIGIYLKPEDIGILGDREPIKDMARVFGRYVHGIMARTYAHDTLHELARYAEVPVINALSDWSHPCQAMADMFTIMEHLGHLAGLKVAFIGDGNNVARSLAMACANKTYHMRVSALVLATVNRLVACAVIHRPPRVAWPHWVMGAMLRTTCGEDGLQRTLDPIAR